MFTVHLGRKVETQKTFILCTGPYSIDTSYHQIEHINSHPASPYTPLHQKRAERQKPVRVNPNT